MLACTKTEALGTYEPGICFSVRGYYSRPSTICCTTFGCSQTSVRSKSGGREKNSWRHGHPVSLSTALASVQYQPAEDKTVNSKQQPSQPLWLRVYGHHNGTRP